MDSFTFYQFIRDNLGKNTLAYTSADSQYVITFTGWYPVLLGLVKTRFSGPKGPHTWYGQRTDPKSDAGYLNSQYKGQKGLFLVFGYDSGQDNASFVLQILDTDTLRIEYQLGESTPKDEEKVILKRIVVVQQE